MGLRQNRVLRETVSVPVCAEYQDEPPPGDLPSGRPFVRGPSTEGTLTVERQC